MSQIFSGKFLWTVITGLVLAGLSQTAAAFLRIVDEISWNSAAKLKAHVKTISSRRRRRAHGRIGLECGTIQAFRQLKRIQNSGSSRLQLLSSFPNKF